MVRKIFESLELIQNGQNVDVHMLILDICFRCVKFKKMSSDENTNRRMHCNYFKTLSLKSALLTGLQKRADYVG